MSVFNTLKSSIQFQAGGVFFLGKWVGHIVSGKEDKLRKAITLVIFIIFFTVWGICVNAEETNDKCTCALDKHISIGVAEQIFMLKRKTAFLEIEIETIYSMFNVLNERRKKKTKLLNKKPDFTNKTDK